MSYHRFTNLLEIFQGDLNAKLTENIESQSFMDLPCNCSRRTKTAEGHCRYGGECRRSIVIYKAKADDGHYYIGSTQQKLKNRMKAHYADVQRLVNRGKTSDSYARFFASKFPPDSVITCNDARQVANVSILWQGNPLSTVKTFGTLNCKLCMKERLYIHKAMQKDKVNNTHLLINSSNELYGACRHKPKFHRYLRS